MEYSKQAHAVYYIRYHIVVSTKYRRKILKGGIGEYFKKSVRQIENHHPDIRIIEVNTDLDHFHIIMEIPPKYRVCDVIAKVKANTGRRMREKFINLNKVYWGSEGIWSIGYFVSTVGLNEEVIRKYIENQGKEDSGQAKLVL